MRSISGKMVGSFSRFSMCLTLLLYSIYTDQTEMNIVAISWLQLLSLQLLVLIEFKSDHEAFCVMNYFLSYRRNIVNLSLPNPCFLWHLFGWATVLGPTVSNGKRNLLISLRVTLLRSFFQVLLLFEVGSHPRAYCKKQQYLEVLIDFPIH